MMNRAVPFILALAMAGVLAAGAVACPMWMSAFNAHSDPCSEESKVPGPCPPSICAAASPYIAAQIRADDLPPLHELPAEAPDAAILERGPAATVLSPQDDWKPPGSHGPLYLRIHVLLI